jgi:hypothetical protein
MVKQVSTALLFILCTSFVSAQKSKPPSKEELAQITARGRMLAEYDVAAWHSTDAVQAMNPEKGTVARYVARKTDSGWAVAYGRFSEDHDKFLVVYQATQAGSPQEFLVKKYDPPLQDTAFYYHGAQAIETALKDFQGEKRPYNVAILLAESNQMYVYVVPAQTTSDVYPLGGDVRYLISPDGSTIVEKRQLHKSILEFRASDDKIKKLAAGYHTHVLSDVPEDTDVFYVLTRRPCVPEFIGTKSQIIYKVDVDGTIVVTK